MALDSLNAKLTTTRTAAEAAQADHRAWMEQIRADRNLSGEGKAAALARNYLSTSRKLQDLKQQETAALTTKRTELERRVFGQFSKDPSAIIAYRDAQERAGRLTDKDQHKALEMLHTASLSDDSTLAAAIVSRALSLGWDQVIDQYTTQNATAGENLKDLANIVRFQENDMEQFTAFGTYRVAVPPELSRYTEKTIERMGDQAEADATLSVPSGVHRMAEALS